MTKWLLAQFGPWGLCFLAVFSFCDAASHVFLVFGLRSLEFYGKVFGFISLVLVFIVAGWRAGLLALAIGLLVSVIGALVARFLRLAQGRLSP